MYVYMYVYIYVSMCVYVCIYNARYISLSLLMPPITVLVLTQVALHRLLLLSIYRPQFYAV